MSRGLGDVYKRQEDTLFADTTALRSFPMDIRTASMPKANKRNKNPRAEHEPPENDMRTQKAKMPLALR